MNVTPKGEPKITVQQEYAGNDGFGLWFLVELYVGCVVWSVILNRPDWTKWLLSWWRW